MCIGRLPNVRCPCDSLHLHPLPASRPWLIHLFQLNRIPRVARERQSISDGPSRVFYAEVSTVILFVCKAVALYVAGIGLARTPAVELAAWIDGQEA